jgi:hypothetical protein
MINKILLLSFLILTAIPTVTWCQEEEIALKKQIQQKIESVPDPTQKSSFQDELKEILKLKNEQIRLVALKDLLERLAKLEKEAEQHQMKRELEQLKKELEQLKALKPCIILRTKQIGKTNREMIGGFFVKRIEGNIANNENTIIIQEDGTYLVGYQLWYTKGANGFTHGWIEIDTMRYAVWAQVANPGVIFTGSTLLFLKSGTKIQLHSFEGELMGPDANENIFWAVKIF